MSETPKKSSITVRSLTEDEVKAPVDCSNGLSANGITHVIPTQSGQREYTGRIEELPDRVRQQILKEPQAYLRSLPTEERQVVERNLRQLQSEGRINLNPRVLRER